MKAIFSALIFSALMLYLVIFVFMNENQRWLLFYSYSAEKYAISLLKSEEVKTPDQFIDYSVSANDGYVIFSEHGEDILYGYFPDKTLLNYEDNFKGVEWVLLKDNWFVLIQN
ncbi:MAG: hypothetical protein ACI9D5_000058 [Candidatus Endobugula sp.]|jgi:hypothetical protein